MEIGPVRDRFAPILLAVGAISIVLYGLVYLNLPLILNPNMGHDDALFITLARHLDASQWLGPYDDRNLGKYPGFPLFIASVYRLGIPYQVGVAVLQVAAALAAALGLRRVTRLDWVAIVALPLLLLHPQSFSIGPILREAIYPAQVLLGIGLLLLSFRSRWQILGFTAAGFVLGWAWITREEGLWLVAGLAVLVPTLAWGRRTLPVLTLAFLAAAFIPSAMVASFNQERYGSWTIGELFDADFVAATSALASVEDGGQKSGVAVTRATREAVYPVSPTFARLRPILERPGYWTFNCGMRPNTCGEISNGWFHWALRAAAHEAGFHDSPRHAARFYRAIADEVEAACADGRLTCTTRWFKRFPTMQTSDLALMPPYLWRLLKRAFLHDMPPYRPGASHGTAAQLEPWLAFLNRPYAFQSPDYRPVFLADPDAPPGRALRFVGAYAPVYRAAIYALTLAIVAVFAWRVATRSFRVDRRVAGIALSLALFAAARIGLMTIIGATSFDVHSPVYFGPTMPIMVLLLLTTLCVVLGRAPTAAPAAALPLRNAATSTDLLAALALAAVVVLGFLSFHARGRDPGTLSPDEFAREYVADPAIRGFVEAVTRSAGGVAVHGWALDGTHPGSPATLYLFSADGRRIGSAPASQVREDVDRAFGDSFGETGFVVAGGRDCAPGERLGLFAVSGDGRFSRIETPPERLLCPGP